MGIIQLGLASFREVPWTRLLPAAILGGLAMGFIIYPLFAGMILGWEFIVMITYLIANSILAIPCAWVAGRIWKPTQNREEFEEVFAAILLITCGFYVIGAIGYSAGFW